MERVRTAVIPAAGLGKRMLPASRSVPKEMVTVYDRPLIQYVVEEAFDAGVERVVLVTARGKTSIEDHFDAMPETEKAFRRAGDAGAAVRLEGPTRPSGSIVAVRQGRPEGLGHAVRCAAGVVRGERFAVLLPDELMLAPTPPVGELDAATAPGAPQAVAVSEVDAGEVDRYGVVRIGAHGSADDSVVPVSGVVEKPSPGNEPSRLAVVGRYVLAPEVMDALAETPPGAGGEIQLTDAIEASLGSAPLCGVRVCGERVDCGRPEGVVEANVRVAVRNGMGNRISAWVRDAVEAG